MQHRVFCIVYSMYAHRWVAALQRCNRSIKDVHYEDLNSVSMLSGQPKAQSFVKDMINMLHMLHTVCTPAEQSCGLDLCKGETSQCRDVPMRSYSVCILLSQTVTSR